MKNKTALLFRRILSALAFSAIGIGWNHQASASGEATAVRTLGIGQGAVPCSKLEQDLNAKSYFQASCLKQKVASGKKANYYKAVGKRLKIDAVLLTENNRNKGKEAVLINTDTGRTILKLSGRDIKDYESLSNALVAAFPYRGFVTSIRGDDVEINLGSKHGMKSGTYLKIFEIDEVEGQSSLAGPQRNLGMIQIASVSEKSSTGKIVDRDAKISRYAKIAHEDAEAPKQSALMPTISATKTQLTVGTELRTIRTTSEEAVGENRDYTMNVTPFLNVGLGRGKLNGQIAYGYAANAAETLSYLSIQGTYLLRSYGTVSSGTTVAGGAWISQYNAAAKKTTGAATLQDFTRYAPFVEARYQKILKDKIMLGATGEMAYLIFTADQDIVKMLTSYSLAIVPSIRLKTTDWLTLEAGLRLQRISVSIKSGVGTSETHSGPFVRGLILF